MLDDHGRSAVSIRACGTGGKPAVIRQRVVGMKTVRFQCPHEWNWSPIDHKRLHIMPPNISSVRSSNWSSKSETSNILPQSMQRQCTLRHVRFRSSFFLH
jgi:hypothetical protein